MRQPKTIDVSGDSLILRIYSWAWDADISTADTCKVLWGYLFLIPNVVVRALAFPFLLLARVLCPPVKRRVEERQETRKQEIEQAIELGEPLPKSRLERFLGRIGDFFSRVAMWFKAHPKIGPGLLVTLYVAVIGWALTLYVLAFINDFWETLWISLIVIGSIALIFAVVAWIAWWQERSGRPGRGVKKFGQVIKAGYYSFKNQTCREFKVID